MKIDQDLLWIMSGIIILLTISSIIGYILKKRTPKNTPTPVIDNLNARTRAWWMMCAVFAVALLTGGIGSILLFALTSFFALREFITLTPTRRSDHRTLFWAFFILLPMQYYLIAIKWYGLFSILIPVYGFLLIPLRSAIAGDSENFLERTAKIQWGLMITVYCVSHVPALLMLNLPGFEGQNAKLILFLVTVVQLSDVLQYVTGKLFGKQKIAPTISPNKTVEGFIGGVGLSSIIGASLWWITPFTVLQAGALALLINLMGFSGGLCMSAIKRDRGIKDFGSMIQGHGGMLDRIDSICFSAPVFFHIVRYYFGC